MTFEESVKFCLTKGYAKFEGRATRSEFWWFYLFYFLVNIAFSLLDRVFSFVIIELIGILVALAILLPYIAVSARRLHDLNLSGWWQCFIYIPFAFLIIIVSYFYIPSAFLSVVASYLEINQYIDARSMSSLSIGLVICGGLCVLIWTISSLVFLILFILRGTRGVNRFGEDPLEKEIFSILQNTKQTQNTEQENSLENNKTDNKDSNS